jgi:hypothetical protein
MVEDELILRIDSTVCDGLVGSAGSARSLFFSAATFSRILATTVFCLFSLIGAIFFIEDGMAYFELDGGGSIVDGATATAGFDCCAK